MALPDLTGCQTFDNIAQRIVEGFLQTVVVVDDRAMFGSAIARSGNTPEAPPAAAEGSVRAGPLTQPAWPGHGGEARHSEPASQAPASAATHGPDESEADGKVASLERDDVQGLDAERLTKAFAQRGLVCAILRPENSEKRLDTTLAAARRADLTVLDWEIHADGGATACSIIRDLVVDASSPPGVQRSLRLIAIYSGETDLRSIIPQIATAFKSEPAIAGFTSDGDFTLRNGFVRIVVLAKSGRQFSKVPDVALQSRVVTIDQLPQRLIAEFTTLTRGIVPQVLLASLAALRNNTPRLLGRLRADLDPGYLWHRAALLQPSEAQDHLVNAIAGEFRTVLEDERVGSYAGIDTLERWAREQTEPDINKDFAADFASESTVTPEDVRLLLELGSSDENVKKKFQTFANNCAAKKKRFIVDPLAGFAESKEKATRSNERFAELLSLETRYGGWPPRLTLGAIIRGGDKGNPRWLLCIQPRCDSIRIKGVTNFPFLPLTNDPAAFGILVPNDERGCHRLHVARKVRDITILSFNVPDGQDRVTAEVRKSTAGNPEFVFVDEAMTEYTWVADLKTDYAQRIVQELASDFSRVGLTESEWLRRASGG